MGACESYILRGRVIEGRAAEVVVVESGDSRLETPGIEGAQLTVQVDPRRASRKTIAKRLSTEKGDFAIPIEEFGAGLLEYEMGLTARKPGFQRAEGYFKLPGQGKRVLIVLTPGRDIGEDDDELLEDPNATIEKYWK